MIIALHSFKGGTGKTIMSINLATLFAKAGKKTCLVELDFSAPSFSVTFKNANYFVNDYFNKICTAENILNDCSSENMGQGKLFVASANPSTEAIRDMASKNRKWEIEALGRLLALKDVLVKEMKFDYVFFDTSPGLQYSSINAIVAADVVLVVSSNDRSDVEGTRRMITDLYGIFEKKTVFIANRVPSDDSSLTRAEMYKPNLLGVVPCSCDIPRLRINGLFAPEDPNHVFMKKLQEIATNIEHVCCSTTCTSLCENIAE